MSRRARRVTLAMVLVVITAVMAIVLSAHRLRTELQDKVNSLDASALLRDSGLGLRVVSLDWEETDFQWLPRPSLILRGMRGRFHSGRPGPGQVSARLDVDELRLLHDWRRLFRGKVDQIELMGGTLECAPDILPGLPMFYKDALDGKTRQVPWSELLDTLGDSEAFSLDPPSDMRQPAVVLQDLELRLLEWEILPGCVFTIREARAARHGEGWDLWGAIEAGCPERGSRALPVRVQVDGGTLRRVEAGLAEGRSAFALDTDASGEWSLKLAVVRGSLAQALLRDRDGLAGRSNWSGPWKLEAEGRDHALSGLVRAKLHLGPGVLLVRNGESVLEAGVRGALLLEPDRLQSSELRLWSTDATDDSATVEFELWMPEQGVSSGGAVQGSLSLKWLGILGTGWSGQGVANADLAFSTSTAPGSDRLQVHSEGTLQGRYESLRIPWLEQPLSDGSFRINADNGLIYLTLDGTMGASSFALTLDDVAQSLPAGELWNDTASRWSFESKGGRLEDFAVSPESAGGIRGVPFWPALPGSGIARLSTGSFHGVPVDEMLLRMRRTLRAFEVDTLDVRIADGWIRGRNGHPETRGDRVAPKASPDLHLEADSLDLVLLAPALHALGLDPGAVILGRLSGEVDLEWTPEYEWEEARLAANGVIEVEQGEVRGHPLLEDLRSWTGLDGLRSLPFRHGGVRFIRGRDGLLVWDDLLVDSSLLRLEGAGTVSGGDTLWAVLRAEVGSGDAWMELLRSVLRPGSAVHIWIEGPAELPDVRVIGSSAYRDARERIRGLFTEASGRRQRSGQYR